MAFSDLFKPKYKNSNPSVRREAVKELDDQNILIEIAKNDDTGYVREEAVKKINDESVLVNIVKNDSIIEVRLEALKKLVMSLF